MENREYRNDEFPIKPLLALGVLYGIYRIVETIVTVLFAFLMGLAYVALGAAGVFVAYWLYQYITNKQYGEEKKTRQIAKLERRRKDVTARLPKHIRDDADQYFKDKQRAVFAQKPSSRFDDVLDRTKQVVSTFRGGRNGHKDSHRP